MCGLVGIVKFNNECVDPVLLKKMTNIISYRGPDDVGHVLLRTVSNGQRSKVIEYKDPGEVSGEDISGYNVGLGFRRLSIIDLSTAGNQPMTNEDISIWIIFNGEFYNYLEYVDDLKKKGHIFKSRSDTEVIIHLYEEYGIEKTIQKMNGMFAFVLYDGSKNLLFAVRDRLGIKPFYYFKTDSVFIFSSEIKSILASGLVPKEINFNTIPEYFTYRYVSDGNTMFANIYSLLPGSYLSIKHNKVDTNKYWHVEDSFNRIHNGNKKTIIFDIIANLRKSIKYQLISDVPLGVLLSGGVDSSLVTALTAKMVDEKIKTFTVKIDDPKYDESNYAREISNIYNTEHYEYTIKEDQFADTLPRIIWFNDEPINHPNSIPMYLLFKFAKEYITVMLSGEGTDELFGGYSSYVDLKRTIFVNKYFPKYIKSFVSRILNKVPIDKAKKLANNFGNDPTDYIQYNQPFSNPHLISSLLNTSRIKTNIRDSILTNNKDTLLSYFVLNQKTYLPSILSKQDKMSMAASVELRVPYLDHTFVEFTNGIPFKYKLKFNRGKYIIKKAAEEYLPRTIIYRRKMGFALPLRKWFANQNALGKYFELLYDRASICQDIFQKEDIAKIIHEHKTGCCDHSEGLLWMLVNFELWHRIYFKDQFLQLT